MKVRIKAGPLDGKEVDMATRQAEVAVAGGYADYVEPRLPAPEAAPVPPPPRGSWLGPPGEIAAAPAERPPAPAGAWLGPPGEAFAASSTAAAPPPTDAGLTGSWLGPPGERPREEVQTSAPPPEAAPPPERPAPEVSAETSLKKRGGKK